MIELPPIETLSKKFRRLYERRRLENMCTYGLRDAEASLEAHQFVAKLIYHEKCKRELKANHPVLFADMGKPGKKNKDHSAKEVRQ